MPWPTPNVYVLHLVKEIEYKLNQRPWQHQNMLQNILKWLISMWLRPHLKRRWNIGNWLPLATSPLTLIYDINFVSPLALP